MELRNLIEKGHLVALLVALAPGAFSADQEVNPPLLGRSTARLVQVNVVATRRGGPVAGLTRDDFTIADNGVSQTVRVFSQDSPQEPPQHGASSDFRLPPNSFTNRRPAGQTAVSGATIILLDALNTRYTDRAFARNEIVRFLKTIRPTDHVGVYALGSGLQILHEYTSPASELIALLDQYKSGAELPSARQADGSKDPLSLQLNIWLTGRGITRSEWESHADERVHTTLRALQAVADHLALVPGRKSLVWVSSGFPPWYGLTRRAGKKAAFPADVEQCVRAVSDANLAIYPVNARGLTIPPGFEDSSVSGFGKVYYSWFPETLPVPQSNTDPMRQLAEGTGGRAYVDTNDLAQAIREAVADSRLTYTLGYYAPGDEPDGRFHTISVRVNQPGIELRYRSGYLNLPLARRDETARKAELQEAASSPIEATGIVLLAEFKPVPGSPGQLECVLRIDPQHVTLESQGGRWAAELDLLFVQNDEQGRQLTGRNDTLRLRLAESSYRQVLRAGIGYRQILDVQPDAAGIRVVVRDAASGSAGSVTAPLSQLR